jgi:aspartate-semialdehyde dehydrogenase
MPELRIMAHATRVPVYVGHSMAVTVELETPVHEDELVAAWDDVKDYVRLVTDGWPSPLSAMQHQQVELGRLRAEDDTLRCWSFFASGDNLTLGAALNGWRILQLMTDLKAGITGNKESADG